MADNGHCSECQVQNSTSACGRNAQAFKTIVGSSQVQAHEKYLKLNLDNTPKINQGETIITKEIWDQLTNILQYLKDYGQIAEDNPTQTKINNTKVNNQDIILLDKYNAILTALDKNNLPPTQLISKDLIDNLKANINLYQLDATRCDVCNLSGCQVSQCCDGEGGGGGGGGDDPCSGGGGCSTEWPGYTCGQPGCARNE